MTVLCLSPMLQKALQPRSVAIVGASDNPHKVGGRPILYMRRYGYKGVIYPVNPGRTTVQGIRAFPRLEDIPESPDLAIIAVAGDEALRAVEDCAARGVGVAVVMASGFGESWAGVSTRNSAQWCSSATAASTWKR